MPRKARARRPQLWEGRSPAGRKAAGDVFGPIAHEDQHDDEDDHGRSRHDERGRPPTVPLDHAGQERQEHQLSGGIRCRERAEHVPRRASNHRVATTAASTIEVTPVPVPTHTPHNSVICHWLCICVVSPTETARRRAR